MVELWWQAPTAMPAFGREFSPAEQEERERHLESFLNSAVAVVRHSPRHSQGRRLARQQLLGNFAGFARTSLDWSERHLDVLLSAGFPEVAVEFAQLARVFDPDITSAEIFQASRNVWTMCGLQVLLGQQCRLTPSAFAYSLLYPYTDNLLDDPGVSPDEKASFVSRFHQRLSGQQVQPANRREALVWDLVGMIEGEWDRATAPHVYESLMAIHLAQIKSMDLLRARSGLCDIDVLGISVEKGGASVLADGYLTAGELTPEQSEFLFGWGAFLQFVDDLQDVARDTSDGLWTVFSRTAGRETLDGITSRTMGFGQHVLNGLTCFSAAAGEPLKELMTHSAGMLIAFGVCAAAPLHSPAYVQHAESHSPFRFSVLGAARERVQKDGTMLLHALEAIAEPHPGSLLPWLQRS